jgi:hypothetical protein
LAIGACGQKRVRAKPAVMQKSDLFVVLGWNDLLAAVKTVRADVVAPMDFARGRLDRDRRIAEEIVRAMRSALR